MQGCRYKCVEGEPGEARFNKESFIYLRRNPVFDFGLDRYFYSGASHDSLFTACLLLLSAKLKANVRMADVP